MRIVMAIVILATMVQTGRSQKIDSILVKSTSDVYTKMIEKYSSTHDSLSMSGNKIYVESTIVTTAELPSKIGSQNIIILDDKDLNKLIKKENSIRLIRLIPIRFDSKGFYATLLIFNVEKHRRKFHYTNLGGFSYYINQIGNQYYLALKS